MAAAQNTSNTLGKIIAIDKTTRKYEFVSIVIEIHKDKIYRRKFNYKYRTCQKEGMRLILIT